MARTHEQDELWEIPAGTDQWEAIRAADAYLRVRIGLSKWGKAAVFDDRGHIFESTLAEAYREWEKERNPLKGVIISYGDRTEGLYAELQAQDLQHEPGAIVLRPYLRITVNGNDAAEVRGIGLEAMDKAKRGIVMPVVEIPSVEDLITTPVVRAEPLPDVSEYLASGPSLWQKFLNVDLAQQIFAGLAVVVIVALAALVVRSLG